ncbi:activator of Hsp90 ATPase [Endogone sp. FLAS-F59071]|nr:activator of Hsp90 ATPase [Endogone sp. FLAS-F59071]|eukprot:RUS21410.1 activator of Hsp90 ATPase [Endogone sp. FLAS-F59071]
MSRPFTLAEAASLETPTIAKTKRYFSPALIRSSPNCLAWAKDYFNEQLVGVAVEKDGLTAQTDSVTEVTGDVDLNQRKGKIITIFDVQMTINWSGLAADGTEVKGKIQIPEIAHDTEIDDYVFDITVFEDKNDKQPIRDLVRKDLTPLLREKLASFSKDLIDAHAKDVYIDPEQLGQAPPPRPAHAETKETVGATRIGASETPEGMAAKVVNTTTLKDTIEFQTSAHELYETLLDLGRVQAWSRGPAIIAREPGSKFELFGGNVTGELVEVVPDKKIIQKWRLKAWPKGHHSTVTFTFNELSESVNLYISQTEVPVGEKDQTQRNWTGYYWNPIKHVFGGTQGKETSVGGEESPGEGGESPGEGGERRQGGDIVFGLLCTHWSCTTGSLFLWRLPLPLPFPVNVYRYLYSSRERLFPIYLVLTFKGLARALQTCRRRSKRHLVPAASGYGGEWLNSRRMEKEKKNIRNCHVDTHNWVAQ